MNFVYDDTLTFITAASLPSFVTELTSVTRAGVVTERVVTWYAIDRTYVTIERVFADDTIAHTKL